jgi:hypothetical protein
MDGILPLLHRILVGFAPNGIGVFVAQHQMTFV